MGGVERFEDLVAWQKARAMTRAIYEVTKKERFSRDFDLVRQTRRASVSTMSKLAEGFERGWNKEFHRFACISKASCAEVRSLLYVACDEAYICHDEFNDLMAFAVETARVIGGLRASLDQ